MTASRTEYQRNYMRDWRAKNPTSRVGKLTAALQEISDHSHDISARQIADEALSGANLSGASYDRDGRFGG